MLKSKNHKCFHGSLVIIKLAKSESRVYFLSTTPSSAQADLSKYTRRFWEISDYIVSLS